MVDGSAWCAGVLEHLEKRCRVYAPGRQELDRTLDHRGSGVVLADVDGSGAHVRVQVLTNAGALDRDKQLAVVAELTRLVGEAAGDPGVADRTWVLLTEAPDGGWGLHHAHTNSELVTAARAEITALSAAGDA
jgi:phenylpyruvate tautomerase PptA (4-oxalocrotonate tautomerase family)